MSYFPFFIDLQGQQGLIIGGGMVALRKARILAEFGAVLTIVSLDFCRHMRDMAEEPGLLASVTLIKRGFRESDLEDKLFVIAATNDEAINHRAAELCRRRNIMVNVADEKEDCSFYFPSLVKKDEIVIGISSGGNSPALARRIRQKAEAVIPDYYPALNEQLGSLRERVKSLIEEESMRKQCFEELLANGERKGTILSEGEIGQIMEKYI